MLSENDKNKGTPYPITILKEKKSKYDYLRRGRAKSLHCLRQR